LIFGFVRSVREVVFVSAEADEIIQEELRRRHHVRMERRLGPADRRQAPREEPPRPVEGAAHAYHGRRKTDRPPE
jgi:hypothetical protein